MAERETNQNNLIIDDDPFSSDFKEKLGKAILQEAGKAALKEGAKVAVCALPFALTACGNSPSEFIHTSVSTLSPNTAGHILGTLSAVEEAFERDFDKNVFRRGLSIGAKYIAGFGIGHALTHNTQSDASWLSGENISQTVLLGLGTYVMVNETSLKRLLGEVGSSVKNSASTMGEHRRQADIERKVRHIANDYYSSNIPRQNAACEQAQQMGISPEQLRQIHNQKR